MQTFVLCLLILRSVTGYVCPELQHLQGGDGDSYGIRFDLYSKRPEERRNIKGKSVVESMSEISSAESLYFAFLRSAILGKNAIECAKCPFQAVWISIKHVPQKQEYQSRWPPHAEAEETDAKTSQSRKQTGPKLQTPFPFQPTWSPILYVSFLSSNTPANLVDYFPGGK